MAKTGKIFALVGAILVILGTYLFSLIEAVPGVSYLYGVGGWMNIGGIFQYATSGASDAWTAWIIGIVLIIYLISGLIMLLGVKSRVVAFLSALIPLAVGVIFILLAFGVSVLGIYILYFLSLGAEPIILNVLPLTFEYGFMSLGWGTIIITLGSLLSLVSAFMSRED